MRIHMGRIATALLALTVLLLLSDGGARGVGPALQGDAGGGVKTAARVEPPDASVDRTVMEAQDSSVERPVAASAENDPEAGSNAGRDAARVSAPKTEKVAVPPPEAEKAAVPPHETEEVTGEVAVAPSETEEAALEEPRTERPADRLHRTPEPVPAVSPPPAPPGDVRALYVTGWTAGSPRMNELIDVMLANGLNAVVIELKGEDGVVSYPTRVPLAREIGADSRKISDLAALVSRLQARGLYVIGRLVAFQDDLLAEARPAQALTREVDGAVWRDADGRAWVDPSSTAVRNYLHTLATEAARAGVDEIQWDYVRFPSDGDLSLVDLPEDQPKQDVISSFLGESRYKLHEAGVAVSADLFGYAAVVTTDVGIGQQLEWVADEVDYVSLMVYPSHFSAGSMGIAEPDRAPGVTVYESMRRAVERTTAEKHRPWLQAFSLRSPYTEREVAAQIAALHALGIRSWILWNASNRYEGKIPTASLVADGVDAFSRKLADGLLDDRGMGGLWPAAPEPVAAGGEEAVAGGLPAADSPAAAGPPAPPDADEGYAERQQADSSSAAGPASSPPDADQLPVADGPSAGVGSPAPVDSPASGGPPAAEAPSVEDELPAPAGPPAETEFARDDAARDDADGVSGAPPSDLKLELPDLRVPARPEPMSTLPEAQLVW